MRSCAVGCGDCGGSGGFLIRVVLGNGGDGDCIFVAVRHGEKNYFRFLSCRRKSKDRLFWMFRFLLIDPKIYCCCTLFELTNYFVKLMKRNKMQ